MAAKTKVLSLVLALLLAVFCVTAVSCNPDNPSDKTDEPTKTSWPEAGVYYFDDVNYENTLTLNVGDTFSLYVKGVLHSGKYTLTDASLVLDFNEEGKENLEATYEGNVVALTFEGANMRLLKKINYTVSFNVDGGSEVAAQTVINGKSATKPADPTRNGFVFVGWYVDAEFTAPYAFGSAPVTADTTVFARWSAATENGKEYTANLDANYEGAEALASVVTVGGKLFNLPTLTREGFTFGGWWFSNEFNGDKLSHKYEEGMLLDANTTLYALWQANAEGGKLQAPVVNVQSGNLSWNTVDGARSYDVKVIGPDGEVLIDATTGSTTYNVPFSTFAAGKYEIKVTALANTGAENNAETVRYYLNKALTKVSEFSVIEPSTLVFNTVENAEKYLVTVVCGNPEHNHTAFDNGTSRVFNFANCTMTADGIKFTVTAVAEGFASSTSDVFVYTRQLDSVSGFRFDEATETLVWNEVASAESYMVSVKCGNAEHNHGFVNFGSQNFVSLKECAPLEGGIVIKVYPKTEGYTSPAASEYVYNKTTLKTPTNLLIHDTVLSWNAVDTANKYEVSVNGNVYSTTAEFFDLSTVIDVVEGLDYAITVRAVGELTSSLPTDVLVARYYELNEKVTYANGKLTWSPVLGADYYELQVNDGEIVKVEGGVFSSSVVLNKSGENTVKVRFVDGKSASEWASTTVVAHKITFDTLGGNTVDAQYKAVGDPMELPEAAKPGYTFADWYNVPGGAASNGQAYTDAFFGESGSVVLYAYYRANKYEISYNYGVGGSADAVTGEVTYDGHFQLIVPTASDVAGAFGGWFSAPYGMGVQYTDESGKSLMPWTHLENKELYAFWIDETLSFTLTKVNGNSVYAVSKGSRIDLVTELTVPATYRGLPVAFVAGNAFEKCTNLTVINLPETIVQMSVIAPFGGCTALTAINIYDVEGVIDPVFASEDGVLLEIASGTKKLALVPMAKTGTYRIPDGVTEIPEAAFANSSLSKVIISPEVSAIGREAFKDATNLSSVIFEVAKNGSSTPLTIGTRAFMNCTKLVKITLPARLTEIKLKRYTISGTNVNVTESENAFDGCTALEAINVATNNQNYKSIDNVLFSKDGRSLLLAPASMTGTYVIPEGTRNIDAGAFVGCNSLNEIILPSSLVLISECAFYGLENLETIIFAGTAYEDLIAGKYAFRNCSDLETVMFASGSRLAELGEGAFMGCTSIEEFTVPATMTKLGASVFADCSELDTLNFEASTKQLVFGANAFQNCTSLKKVNLPANVSKIPGVFAGCSSLTEVNIDPASTYFTSVDGVVYDFNKTEIVFFPQGKEGHYEVPSTVTSINNGVFENARNLSKMTITNNVNYIGEYAFNNASIPEIEFVGDANGTLVIASYAFANAELGTLTLPNHTVSIGDSAFYMTSADAIVLNEGITELGAYTFWGAADVNVTIPASVKSIGEYCFGGYIEEDWWDGNTYYFANPIFTVEGSVLETIGDNAFRENANIKDLVIPASVKTIGNYAFFECSELATVTFDGVSALESIGAFAFAYDYYYYASDDFTEITIPTSVKTIGANAFAHTRLETVTFEDGTEDLFLGHTFVESYYNESMGTTTRNVYRGNVFANSSYLETVVLPARLTTLETRTFYEAGTSGFTVTISNIENSRLTTIGEECFYYSELTSFVIPKSVSNLAPITDSVSGETYNRPGIGAGAFKGLYSTLTSVTFEMGGTLPLTIGASAFDNAAKLTEMVLPARLANYTTFDGEVLSPLANGALVFNSCDDLASITVEDAAGSYYTSKDGVLMTADLKEIVLYPMGREGSFVVPAEVTKIHDYAFYEASNLTDLTFAGGTEDMIIGASAFERCYGLVNVVLPDNVVFVGARAFYYCSALETLTLSKNLESFDYTVVELCKKLSSITVSTDGLGEKLASKDGVLYNADFTELLIYPANKADVTEFFVPETVKVIASHAFYENSSLNKVVLKEGLVEIGTYAFDGCSALTEINIPSTVQLIGRRAFGRTYYLTNISFTTGGDDLLIVEYEAFYSAGAYEDGIELVVFPARIFSIGERAFYDSAVKNILFEDNSSLQSIGRSAFMDSKIVSITIPDGITNIGDYAFSQCEYLREVYIGEGITELGNYVFSGNPELITVAFPSSLKNAGIGTFYYSDGYDEYTCPKLTYVTFGENSQLEVIPAGMFAYTNISGILIPATVKYIGSGTDYEEDPGAFEGCKNLTVVRFELGSLCSTIGDRAFYGCSALEEVEIPTSVGTLGSYAFSNCTSLTSITIPATVTNLGAYLFQSNTKLEEVNFESKATVIPTYMFAGCTSLTSINIPTTVSTIQSGAFTNTGLTSVTIPANVVNFEGYGMFSNNSKLTGVTILGNATTIVRSMFSGCTALTDVVLPSTIQLIDEEAFEDCTSLTTFKVPASTTEIDGSAFNGSALAAYEVEEGSTTYAAVDGVLFNVDKTAILVYPVNKSDESFTVPANVTYIGSGTFSGISALKFVYFEDGETELEIGEGAFYGLASLQKISLPNRLAEIGDEAFAYCSSLVSITLPSTLTEDMIGEDAFYGCSKLVEICNKSTLELEKGSSDYGYLAANAIRIYTDGESVVNVDDNGYITMGVDGEVYLIGYAGDSTELYIPEGVTIVKAYAFNENDNITKVVMPETLKVLEEGAFYYCGGITEVQLSASLTTIGDGAFYYCYNLTTFTIPEGSQLKTIGEYAFYECAFNSITLPEGFETIGDYAFYYSDIEEIVLPSTVTYIGEKAFYYSNIHGNIVIPASVETIGYRALYVSNDITFYVAAIEKPDGWDDQWNRSAYSTVLWGFSGTDVTYNFETNGGSAVDSITSGMPINLPAAPTRDGYIFGGWYNTPDFSGEELTGSYYNGELTTIYAKWLTQEEFEALFAGTSLDYAIEIVLGSTNDCIIDNSDYPVKYYVFTATESGTYVFYSHLNNGNTGKDLDTYGYIYDENGKQLETEDYSSGGDYYHFYLTYDLEAGKTYYFGAKQYSGNTAEFYVTLEKLDS